MIRGQTRFQWSESKSTLSKVNVLICLSQTSLCVVLTGGPVKNEESRILSRCGVSSNAVEPRN